jgi:ABC-2 type transport system permease protein
MAANIALVEVKDRGWLNGLGNLLRKENRRWWGTRTWIIQIVIWTGFSAVIMASAVGSAKSGELGMPPLDYYFLIVSMFTAIGVTILGQDALIDERKLGTASWVLSKPVSRAAFILSKVCAYALGMLVTMVLVPGVVAYFICAKMSTQAIPFSGFAAGMGLLYLVVLYMLMLTVLLGAFFHSRKPVIAIPLALVFSSQMSTTAWMGYVLPWNLVMTFSIEKRALAVILAEGQSLTNLMPIYSIALITALFAIIAMVRFERDEF